MFTNILLLPSLLVLDVLFVASDKGSDSIVWVGRKLQQVGRTGTRQTLDYGYPPEVIVEVEVERRCLVICLLFRRQRHLNLNYDVTFSNS